MDRLSTRQIGRQRTTHRLGAGPGRRRRRTVPQGLELGFHCGNVCRHRLVEQLTLRGVHALGLGRKLYPSQARQLVGEFVDLGGLPGDLVVAPGDGDITLRDLGHLLAHQRA